MAVHILSTGDTALPGSQAKNTEVILDVCFSLTPDSPANPTGWSFKVAIVWPFPPLPVPASRGRSLHFCPAPLEDLPTQGPGMSLLKHNSHIAIFPPNGLPTILLTLNCKSLK